MAYNGHLSGVVRFSLSRLKGLASTAEATGKLILASFERSIAVPTRDESSLV
jgi:hypothetical protein